MNQLFGCVACLLLAAACVVSEQTSDTSRRVELGPNGMNAGDYVYVSGQGPQRADGSTPADFAAQARQCLDNVRTVLEKAGITIDHVVYTQAYLEDVAHYRELNDVYAAYFPHDPPARGVLGVARVPGGTLHITAVAVRDIRAKRAVSLPNASPNKAYSVGMLTHDRLFVSTMPGVDLKNASMPRDPAGQVNLALDQLKAVTEAAGLSLAHMVFVNPYLTTAVTYGLMNEQYARRFEFGNTPARATIEVASLPQGAQVAFTGIAVRDLSQRHGVRPKNMAPSPTASPCVFAGDTLYCSAKSGFIPGPNGGIFTALVPDQTRQTMRNLLDNLEEADMNFDQVVSTTIYLDDLKDAAQFAKVYTKYFKGKLPAKTVVQQVTPVERKMDEEDHYPTLEQVSLIAVRGRSSSIFVSLP